MYYISSFLGLKCYGITEKWTLDTQNGGETACFYLFLSPFMQKKMKNKKECSYHSMDLSWHALNSMLQVKIPITLKNKDFATCGFQKMFQTHPPKPAEAKPSFRNVSLPLQNYSCFSPLTSGLEF